MRPSPDIGPRSFEAWDTLSACRTFSGMVSPGESIRVPVSPTNMTRQATAVPTKRRSRMSMGTPLDFADMGAEHWGEIGARQRAFARPIERVK